MARLIAKRPILYNGRMFQTGDELPQYDEKMIRAWLQHKSAEYEGQEDKPEEADKQAEADKSEESDKQEKETSTRKRGKKDGV